LISMDPELQAISVDNYEFQNWAKTFRCRPELLFEPKTESQVIKIVQHAKKNNKRIRVFGSGHSPSDLACSKEYMVNIDHLNNVLSVDRENCVVSVQGGMSLHKLHVILNENQLAMSNLGSISDQTVAGVIATASHGTGAHFGCLSTFIVDMTLVTASGELVRCSATEQPDLFKAAQCHMGALGVVTRVTLQVEPAFRLEAVQRPYKFFQDVLPNWDQVIHSSEHTRVWWYPHTDDCVVWRANRTDRPVSSPAAPSASLGQRLGAWWYDRFLGFHFYQSLLNLTRYKPSTIPSLTRFMFSTVHTRPFDIVDDSYKVFNFDCLFPQYVNEWAIDWKDAPAFLRDLNDFINTQDLKVHFPVEIRFVDEDDVWLSPAYGRKTCYIGVIMYRPYGKPVPYKKYWKGYEDLMRKYGGRPHWAK
ncbi:L-gulonolactone/D-arabinono-1,4-lactone oxidase, partial [Hesseltinella vesiculosa]